MVSNKPSEHQKEIWRLEHQLNTCESRRLRVQVELVYAGMVFAAIAFVVGFLMGLWRATW
jgi:hypothetical protein